MREAARFLETLSDILDVVTREGMESGELALLLEAARKDVETVRLADPSAKFEIGEGDVFWRGRPLAGTVEWSWRQALLDAGVERLAPPDEEAAFRSWVGRISGKLTPDERAADVDPPPESTADAAPAIEQDSPPAPAGDPPTVVEIAPAADEEVRIEAPERAAVAPQPPSDALPLDEEAERVWWLYGEAANRGQVPRRESEDLIELLVRVLSRGPARAVGRALDDSGELTTPHLVNVMLLAMGVGKHLAFDDAEVRALGLGALYHDVGRVRLDARRADGGADSNGGHVREHPAAGARVLMDSGSWFAVAAVVAYEHHLTWRGTGGYPTIHFNRPPHQFSRIVTVCDIYDALRTERPYREALTADAASEYLRMLAGKTLDPEIVTGVVGYAGGGFTRIEHPRSRPEAGLAELRWLPDSGFDPDQEPRPISI